MLRTLSCSLLAATLLITGCSHTTPAATVESHLSLGGSVHGGQQPVTNSIIQLYAVGTAGDGSPSLTLLTTPVQSDSSGSFSITGDYHCPSDPTLVYLVASAGNPGLGAGANNPNLAMMAALGPCGSLTPATNVSLDELTTVGSIGPLYPFMSGFASVGSGTSDAAALTTAFSTVNQYTNVTSGVVPGPTLPAGYYASSTEINTLSDILAACINSSGGTAGDKTPCGQLFTLTTSPTGVVPTDTIGAAIEILQNPTRNLAALLNLIPPTSPYLPILTAPPTDITLKILPMAATPTISPAGYTFNTPAVVTLSDSTPGATIYYTLDGSTPTSVSPTYSAPLTFSASQTVNAIAYAPSYGPSSVASATYTYASTVVIAPSVSLPAGTYSGTQSVTLSSPTAGAVVHYTVNGTTPTSASPAATAPIAIPQTLTLKSIATASGVADSPVTTTAYTILQPAPYITPDALGSQNFYADRISVNFVGEGTGTVVYTTDGSTPVATSPQYSSPFTLTSSTTVKAAQVANGTVGNVASTSFAIKPTTITFTVPPGSYTGAQTVALSTNLSVGNTAGNTGVSPLGYAQYLTAGAYLYYTLNGGTPILYVGSFSVPASTTVLAAIADSGFDAVNQDYYTSVGPVAYTITNPVVATPTFSVAAGSYNQFQTVTLADTTANAAIYYTLDGTPPTALSTRYTGPISISSTRTINAIGILSGYTSSAVATATYSIIDVISTIITGIHPQGLAFDPSGNLYVSSRGTDGGYYDSDVLLYTAAGTLTSIYAGNGNVGFSGDGGPAASASMHFPDYIAISGNGTLYIADTFNSEVRSVNTSNHYIASYTPSYSVSGPIAVSNNDLYFAHGCSITLTTGAGATPVFEANTSTCGYNGDGAIALSTQFSNITGLTTTPGGQVYVSDTGNNRIRTFLQSSNIVSTVAGTGTAGFSGDGLSAKSATISGPGAITVDASGNVYFVDLGNNRIRKITAAGVISTIAGNGTAAYTGDGGGALLASINKPQYIAVDSAGNIYLSSFGDNAVRKITIAHQ